MQPARTLVRLAVGACVFTLAGCAHTSQQPPLQDAASGLIGDWRVDLRPTPDAEPYYQTFSITGISGSSFDGTFYGSPVREARLNRDWGTTYLSFVTEDGSGPYLHAGELRGGRIHGLTNSTGREFLAVWTAEPARDSD